jgi:7-cyano-7-deazaguanine synthase
MSYLAAPAIIGPNIKRTGGPTCVAIRPMNEPERRNMANEKAVVLMSGGLNSAVAAALAAADHTVAALHVRLGQCAEDHEAVLFEKQADHFNTDERLVLEMPHLAMMGGSARVARSDSEPDTFGAHESGANYYLPGLVGSLLQAGFAWSRRIGAVKLFIGVSENLGPPEPATSQAWPDYSREYLQLCSHLLAVASPAKPVSLEAPLADLSRTEIIRLGRRLAVPFELTWSCLASGAACCGCCPGCTTRNRGFLDAAIPDPILLEAVAR